MMSDVDTGTPSGEDLVEEPQPHGAEDDVAQLPTAQQQGQEEDRYDLTPDASLSPRPERFRTSNMTGNWVLMSRGEAREANSDDSGHDDDYKSNLDTDTDDPSAPSLSGQKTGLTYRGGAGEETPLKTIAIPKPQQQSLRPAGTKGNASGFAQPRDKSNSQQPNLKPVGTEGNVSMFPRARDQTYTQQQSLGPAGIEGNASGFAQARNKSNTQHPHPRLVDMRCESEKTFPTGPKGDRGTVDVRPERNPKQKSPMQADTTQTQKQEPNGEMSKRSDTRVGALSKRLTVAENIERSRAPNLSEIKNRNLDNAQKAAPVQMNPLGQHVLGGPSAPLGQEQGPSATAVIRPSANSERSTSVKQPSGATGRAQTLPHPGPTPAASEEVDRAEVPSTETSEQDSTCDTDVACTTSVGFLLDLAEGGRNNTIKERILFEMSQHPASIQQTAYGLGAQFLGFENWKLEKLWDAQVPGCDAKMERVKNILKALVAEGKTMNHILLYFIQEQSRRLDIVTLIMEIHQCDCCKKILKNVDM